MTKFAMERMLANRQVPIAVQNDYKREIEVIRRKYAIPIHIRIKNGIVNLFPEALIYVLLVGAFATLWAFPVLYYPLGDWLETSGWPMMVYCVFWLALAITCGVMTFKSFGFVMECFSDALSNYGSAFEEQKMEVIKKYNEMGYYPQYEKITDAVKADGHCAYYDDYQECFRCPVDDSLISKNQLNYKCLSSDCHSCLDCEKIKTYTYSNFDI